MNRHIVFNGPEFKKWNLFNSDAVTSERLLLMLGKTSSSVLPYQISKQGSTAFYKKQICVCDVVSGSQAERWHENWAAYLLQSFTSL